MDGILSNCNSTFSFFFSCTQSISNNEYCQFKILKDMRKPIGFHEFQVDGKVWIGNGTRSAFLFLRLAGRAGRLREVECAKDHRTERAITG